MSRLRGAILVSGRGSNMGALLDAAADPAFPVGFVLVLSNRPDAPALMVARGAGVATVAIDHRPFGADRAAHEAAIDEALRAAGVEIICLAGYMRRMTPFLVGRWAQRMLNIHPSLLPSLPGLDTHERALATGLRLHGCTVHLVTETVDDGPILGQAAVPVLPGDTADTLASRVLAAEHLLYPATLAAHVLGRPGRAPDPTAALLNPLPLRATIP
jgi:phosphoribosylglycinamide formyltransferase-1